MSVTLSPLPSDCPLVSKNLSEATLARKKAKGLYNFYWSLRGRELPTLELDKLPDQEIILRIETWLNTTDFSNLRTLCLSNSGLKFIPEQIRRFSNLTWLSLLGNKLKDLPDSMKELANLEHLDITENKFSTSPIVIDQIASLKFLFRDDSIGSSKLIGPFEGEVYLHKSSGDCAIL